MTGFGLARLARLAPSATSLTAVSAATAAVTSLLIPLVSAHAVDQVLRHRDLSSTLVLLTGLLVARLVAEACGQVAEVSASTAVGASLRGQLLRRVFALGIPGQRRYATGDLVTRLLGNSAVAAEGVPAIATAVVAAASSLGGLIALSLIDWWLAAVFVIGIIPALLLLRRLMHQVSDTYFEYIEHLAAIAARLSDALAGSRTIRASGTSRREVERVLVPLPDLARSGMRAWEVQRAGSWQVGLVITGIRVAVLFVAGIGVAEHRISPGEFVASSLYLTIALGFVSQADTLLRIGDAWANAGRVLEVLGDDNRHGRAGAAPGGAGLPAAGPGALSFRGVSVRAGDRIVLDRVDLDVPAGCAVAVVGRSGAGKTSLALLAGRLLDPDEGEILIDGTPVSDIDTAVLRREVSYAFDRPVLLGATVRSALSYGCAEGAPSDPERAAAIAQAADFVRRLPDGFDTSLAHTAFSGGELQRLGLARAVTHGGRILVLDDATSSLDTVTEVKVADALTTGLAGRTRLVVAHRAMTAARADLVAWLDGGRIRAMAPHHVLWDAEADYRAAFGAEPQPDEEES